MLCPDCGYALTAFDADCPRCKKLAQKPEQEKPGQGSPPDAASSRVNPYVRFQEEQARQKQAGQAPAVTPPASPPKSALPGPEQTAPATATRPADAVPVSSAPLSGDLLACPVCGNQGVQKVTAICQSGTWTTHSQGYAVVAGGDASGDRFMAGGPTRSTTRGQTSLASSLMPPPRPAFRPFSGLMALFILVLCGIGLALLFAAANDYWDVPTAACGLALCAGAWLLGYAEGGRVVADSAQADAALPAWQAATDIWGRLFYCGRCDHAYDAKTRQAAPAYQVGTLYPRNMAPVLLPDRLSRAALLGVTLGVCALLLGLVALTGHAQRAADEARLRQAKAPLLTQCRALSGLTDSLVRQGTPLAAATNDYDYRRRELSDALTDLKAKQSMAGQDLHDFTDWRDADARLSAIRDDFASLSKAQTDARAQVQALRALAPSVAPVTGTPPAFTMRTRAGGGDAPPALDPAVNLPPVTLTTPAASDTVTGDTSSSGAPPSGAPPPDPAPSDTLPAGSGTNP